MKYLYLVVFTVLRTIKAKTRKGGKPPNLILITVTALQFTFPTPDWLLPVNIVIIQKYFWCARFGSLTVICFVGCPVIIWQTTPTGSSSHNPLGRSLSEIGFDSYYPDFLSRQLFNCLCWLQTQELDKYIHPKSGVDCHFHGIAAHALLANKLVSRDLHFQRDVVRGSSCEWGYFRNYITSILTMGFIAFDRYTRVLKQALYNRLFPSKRTARLCRMDSFYVFCNTAIVQMGKDSATSSICYLQFCLENCAYVICSGNRRRWEQHNRTNNPYQIVYTLHPHKSPESDFSQYYVPLKNILLLPNLPDSKNLPEESIFGGTDPLGTPVMRHQAKRLCKTNITLLHFLSK